MSNKIPNPNQPPVQGLWSDQVKTIRIPVRIRIDGRIDYFYGGALPKMREGTIGDLVVSERSITDNTEVRRLQQEQVVPFLPAGSIVKFVVDGSYAPPVLKQHLEDSATQGMKKSHAVQVTVGNLPLKLRLRGTKPATLGRVTCSIPSLQIEAKSLNHAYRLVSEQFEPRRLSHSGNVFELGYCERFGRWVSLDALRETIAAGFEMRLSRTAARVLEQLSETVGSELRECWLGSLQPPRALLEEFDRWQSQSQCEHGERPPAGIQTTLKQFRKILTSISSATSEEDIRLVQAAVKFLGRANGEEHATRSSVGFDAEVLVMRTVAKTTQIEIADQCCL